MIVPLLEPVLVLAPHGRDAQVAAELLARHYFPVHACATLAELAAAVAPEAAAAVIAEEALAGEALQALIAGLEAQEPWSDFPFVVLADGQRRKRTEHAQQTLDGLRNVILLERPLHAEALVRAVRSACNSRRRQYDARAIMARSRDELESLVAERTAEREAALAQLHEASKLDTIGKLTGGIAHDFNNLLTPVVAGLDMLRRRHADDQRSARIIDGAMQASERATTLVQRLLAFARRQDLKPASVDIASLVEGISDLIKRAMGPAIALVVEAEPGLPAALVDANQLELAVLNLAINARDAMVETGILAIGLRCETVTDDDQRVAPGRYLVLSVTDSGCGMDDDTVRRAIEPFFSTKAVGKGTGLGLSMVHGLAMQSGGDLTLRSRPGCGTTVELWLQTTDTAAQSLPAADGREPMRGGPATILLVDDEDLVRAATAEVLADLGYTVIQARSGSEALALLAQAEGGVDLVVTDYLMPGMTGAVFARQVREYHPALPILLLTGYTDLADTTAHDLPRLGKPYRQVELADQVARLLLGAAAMAGQG